MDSRVIGRPEGRIMSVKNSKTPSGIEAATFRLVAQCLNQLPRAPGYAIYIAVTEKHMLLFEDMEIRFSHIFG